MTDLVSGQLFRRFMGAGADDETHDLQERVRSGELELERVALAAHLGHAAAEWAVAAAPFSREEDPLQWILQSRDVLGGEGLTRVAIGATRAVSRFWNLIPMDCLEETLPCDVLPLLEEWVLDPRPELTDTIAAAVHDLERVAWRLASIPEDWASPPESAVLCLQAAAQVVRSTLPLDEAEAEIASVIFGERHSLHAATVHARRACEHAAAALGHASATRDVFLEPHPVDVEEILSAVHVEVVTWLLGTGDSVETRRLIAA